jgi:histidine triad (HIT) family protein
VSDDCFVCRKHRGEEPVPGGPLYEDDLVYASHVYHAENPTPYLGHLIVEPKRHAPGLADLTDEEGQAVGMLAARASRALYAEGAEWVYALVLGHHIPHLHLHLVPRYPGTPEEYRDPMRIDEWEGAKHGGPEQVADLADRLRAHF